MRWDLPLKDWNWECQFEDVQPHPPYKALMKHQACSPKRYVHLRLVGNEKFKWRGPGL